jgi:hypothetical protein
MIAVHLVEEYAGHAGHGGVAQATSTRQGS